MQQTAPTPPTIPPATPSRFAWLLRYRHWLAPLSFAAGLASFLLIQRGEHVAKALAITLLLSWLGIWLEGPLTRGRLPRGLLRFLVQSTQQESFFFALPFFFATTTWQTPQAVFTGALTLAAFASLWDPLYFGAIVSRRPLLLVFHALSVFAAMLVALPILLHLTTAQSVSLAAGAIVLFTVPGLALALDHQRPLHWFLMVFGACALGGGAWLARPWIPPATLWVQEAVITDRVDAESKAPGPRLFSVSPAQVHAQGLYAWTAIHAPRGLHERVFHRWLQDGREVDRIPLEIQGGREDGYRAWSYKKGFPADPRGDWRVEAVTEGGQLIGRVTFLIVGDAPAPNPETPPPPADAPASPAVAAPAEAIPSEAPTPEPAPAPVETPPSPPTDSAPPAETPPTETPSQQPPV
jgi:hypothetical protein